MVENVEKRYPQRIVSRRPPPPDKTPIAMLARASKHVNQKTKTSKTLVMKGAARDAARRSTRLERDDAARIRW